MILHFDFSTGASGDKVLGALIEVSETLGLASFEEVAALAKALVPGVQIERTAIIQGGIKATGVSVEEDSPPHRHWSDIRQRIVSAGTEGILSERATAYSLAAFESIAKAEAAVHGVELDHVHFHEVGAADSIIDICCSSFLFDRLDAKAIFATPLALGFGSFVCAHGELSVPAPATARLIEGLPVYAGSHEGELTTPTGAALARSFVSDWQPLPCVQPTCVGYGAGTREIPGVANVVRVLSGKRLSIAGAGAGASRPRDRRESENTFTIEGCALLETNIDHLSPEALAFVCEELLAEGALDVWQEPITMKKGRLAVRLGVLSDVGGAQCFAERVSKLTGSLGIRSRIVERVVAPRDIIVKDTAYGPVPYKVARFVTHDGLGGCDKHRGSDGSGDNDELSGSGGGRGECDEYDSENSWARPEYEVVARIAREQGLDFNALYRELTEKSGFVF